MKYLNNRESFLNSNSNLKKDFKLIKENTAGAGPFANEINWGDSLLGRLVNHFTRKAGIGVDMMKISNVTSKLEQEFKNIIDTSMVLAVSDEDKVNISRLKISSLIGQLRDVVYDKKSVKTIKSVCDSTISEVESIEESDLGTDLNKSKLELLEKLKEFRKFLDQFKDDEGGEDKEGEDKEGEDKEGEDKEGEDKSGEGSDSLDFNSSKVYMSMINNLKSLSLMLKYYKNVKLFDKEKIFQKQSQENFIITKGGETVKSIQMDKQINKIGLQLEEIWKNNSKILQPYLDLSTQKKVDKNTLQLKAGLKINLSKVNESYIYENKFGTGGGSDRSNVKSGEDHLSQAFSKIKKDLEILISDKEKGIGISSEFLDQIVSNSKDEENRKVIRSLYREVKRYLVGDKKATIQEKDALYKESIDIIKDKNKKVIVAEKIARLSKRAIQFDGKNLYGGMGEFGQALKQFVDTLKPILNSTEKESENKTEEKKPTSENVLTNYSKFVKLIREADGDEKDSKDDDSNPDKIKTQTTSDKIIEYFDKNMNFDAWVIEKTEAEKIEKNIEKYSKGEDKEIVLSGIDPILNIVKLFNRAYKIHTVPVIPGGRSGGVMSGIGGRKTFSEYDAFGYTSGEPNAVTQGPYRNKKVFNIWEDAVLDIMSKREYQPIFSKKTKIQVGNELKPNVGVALRQFMTDMLDGEKLYKGERGEGGSTQKKFLAKYFGDIVDTKWEELPDGKISYSVGGEPDVVGNGEQAGKIPSPKYGFFDEKKTNIDNTEGIVFSIFGKDNTDKDIRYYGFVRKEEGGFLYLVYSSSFFIIRNICGQSIKGSPEFEPGDGKLNMSPTAKLYSTKIKIEDFKNMIKSTGKLNLKGIDFDSKSTEVIFNNVERRYILSNEKDGKFTNLLVKDRSTITDWCNKNNVNIKDDKIPESTRK